MFRRIMHCSFCGKDETQVSKLVAGPKVYICDTCVATARHIMDNSKDGDDMKRNVSLPQWRRLLARILQIVNIRAEPRRVCANNALECGRLRAALNALARGIPRGR